ncbi:DedA family protein [Aurantiacibacter gangjinensis]|uniref:Uncharacterized protein n=1 Tax=Aurantiacibacter gangjinensis TaxID=502682 RepID=A0A0G9MVI3_9SPHN|nr:VTT domain-containing protein [Aurantiacibacter gangjinensis]APE29232.1 hypothetical protein BMF35_a2403 [Aurantiacibacter gangjinensis]KLE33288.1 hypothetical protein AAW01_04885 [Aurantiacibacter gangjinensis]
MRQEKRSETWRRWAKIGGLAFTLFVVPMLVILPFGGTLIEWTRTLADAAPAEAFATIVGLLALDAFAALPHGLIGALAGSALDWWLAALATWLGIMAASLIAYCIGRYAGRPLARRLLGEKDMQLAEARAAGISALLLFATRPVPVVGEVILIAAGIACYPMARFLTSIGMANALLALAYTGLGGAIGEDRPEDLLLIATIGIPALGIAGFALVTTLRRNKA